MNGFTVALDAMGGDLGVSENVKGALLACAEIEALNIILVGKEEEIKREISASPTADKYSSRITIANAAQVIENSEKPTAAIKEKKDSSMTVGLKILKDGGASAFVSSGSTGALLTGATFIVGRSPGVLRPALGAILPGANGYTVLIDVGANLEAKPAYLAQFAAFGAAYAKCALNVENPSVGLINVGDEKEKGTPTMKEAYELLEKSGLTFKGNIETREIPYNEVDVAVCDAFVGNAVLKFAEGFSKALMSMLKKELTSELLSSLGALMSGGAYRRLRKKFDYKEVGGAPFLGLNGLVIKAHGNSDARAVKNAVRQSYNCVDKGILSHISGSINKE